MNALDNRAAAGLKLRDLGERFGDLGVRFHQPGGGIKRGETVAFAEVDEFFAARDDARADVEVLGEPGDRETVKLFVGFAEGGPGAGAAGSPSGGGALACDSDTLAMPPWPAAGAWSLLMARKWGAGIGLQVDK
ncbi:MAG: hypothetical protein KGJ78_11980 [Alphaproteobacteria bacterium]|nr:hypothetical protein [Alphaproteobacteria bacterium]